MAVSNKFGNDEGPEKIEKSSYGGGFGEESSPNMGDGEENPSSDFLDQLNLKVLLNVFVLLSQRTNSSFLLVRTCELEIFFYYTVKISS